MTYKIKIFLLAILIVFANTSFAQNSIPVFSNSIDSSLNDVIPGEQINSAIHENIISAISGRTANAFVSTATSGFGGSSRITMTGLKYLIDDNQPLIILDGIPINNNNYSNYSQVSARGGYDYGIMGEDLNQFNIESVSFIKGGRSMLYGEKGKNGVILITSNHINSELLPQKEWSVSLTSGFTMSQVSVLPKYQNIYGGGWFEEFDTTVINGVEYLLPKYRSDESWGPKMQGQNVLHWWGLADYENGITDVPETASWSKNENNIKDFFNTGLKYSNQINAAFRKQNYTLEFSVLNENENGVFPNSKSTRNNVKVATYFTPIKNLKIQSQINYIKTNTLGRAGTGYSLNNVMLQFNQWGQRQWNMQKMKNYINPDGSQRAWNRRNFVNNFPVWHDNPYWIRNKNYQTDEKDRTFGQFGAIYQISEKLSFSGFINYDAFKILREERIAVGSVINSEYRKNKINYENYNAVFTFDYNTSFFQNLNFYLNGGIEYDHKKTSFTENKATNLVVPDLYSFENTEDPVFHYSQFLKNIQFSQFAFSSLNYKSVIALEFIFRNDFFPLLNGSGVNTYSYSPIITLAMGNSSFLNNIKIINTFNLRSGISSYRSLGEKLHNIYDSYFINQYQYGWSNNTIFESGFTLTMLNNRIGVEFNYYQYENKDQPVDIVLSDTTSYILEIGNISNKIYEFEFLVVPVNKKHFRWQINASWRKNINMVSGLPSYFDELDLSSYRQVNFTITNDKPFGTFIGSDAIYDDRGNMLVTNGGTYLESFFFEPIGNIMPDYTAGITNTFRFKNISFSALIDIRKGGEFFSTTQMFGRFAGVLEETAGYNNKGIPIRNPVPDGGGIQYENTVIGHIETSTGEIVIDNDENLNYYDANFWATEYYFGPKVLNMISADYIKLREVSFGYHINSEKLQQYWINDIQLSVFGRNLALWGTKTPHVDPERVLSSNNIQGFEGAALPGVRSIGFILKVGF